MKYVLEYWELIVLLLVAAAMVFTTVRVKVPNLLRKVGSMETRVNLLEAQITKICATCETREAFCTNIFDAIRREMKTVSTTFCGKVDDMKRGMSHFEDRMLQELKEFDAKRETARDKVEEDMSAMRASVAALATRVQSINQDDLIEQLGGVIRDSVQQAIKPSSGNRK